MVEESVSRAADAAAASSVRPGFDFCITSSPSASWIAALTGLTVTALAVSTTKPSRRRALVYRSASCASIGSLRNRCQNRSKVLIEAFSARARSTAPSTLAVWPSSRGVTVQVLPPTVTVIGPSRWVAAPARTARTASPRVMPLTSTPSTVTPGRIRSARDCS